MTDRDTLIAEAERRAKSGQLCITAKPALPMARWCDACVIRSLLTLVREDGPRLREYAQHKAGCKAINGVWCVPVFQDGDIMTGLRALSHEEHEASKVCTCGLNQLLRGEDGPREQPVPEKPLPHEQALQTEEEKKTLSRGDGQG
jgi:hypothetical protein